MRATALWGRGSPEGPCCFRATSALPPEGIGRGSQEESVVRQMLLRGAQFAAAIMGLFRSVFVGNGPFRRTLTSSRKPERIAAVVRSLEIGISGPAYSILRRPVINMLARLFVLLPSAVTVPDGEQFPIYEYGDADYRVRVCPPRRSDRAPAPESGDQIKIDGVYAFQADALQIDFHKESFERGRESPCDPPEAVIGRAINSFLLRLRHVTRAGQIRPINFPFATWRLQYLNDDETELEKDEKLLRGRGTLSFSMSWVALNRQVWEDIHTLPVVYEPPPWEGLLLDAHVELPRVGPALVLAATALEVFVSHILDKLAALNGVPTDLWTWINQRGDWLREPSTEEQYDSLLRILTRHSLKEDQRLWELFKNLKAARNSFVHEGVAKIGGDLVTNETAPKLIRAAAEIIAKIREWIPQELHWPEFRHTIQVEALRKLM